MPDAEGRALELVLADPARGDLRWEVPPTRSAWYLGVQNGSLYGSYVQATSISEPRLAPGARRAISLGRRAGLDGGGAGAGGAPLGELVVHGHRARRAPDPAALLAGATPTQPIRLGPYLGRPDPDADRDRADAQAGRRPQPPPVYGQGGPEVGLELDIGALRNAATPFPLSPAGRNPLPRWLVRVGYTHSWIGHGTADGYITSVRLTW